MIDPDYKRYKAEQEKKRRELYEPYRPRLKSTSKQYNQLSMKDKLRLLIFEQKNDAANFFGTVASLNRFKDRRPY